MKYEIEIRHYTQTYGVEPTVRVVLPDEHTPEMFAAAQEGARELACTIFELSGLENPNRTNEASGPIEGEMAQLAKGLATQVAEG